MKINELLLGESLDLYKYHANPETLFGYDQANDVVPSRVLKLAKKGKKLNPRQIQVLASDAETSYYYALFVIKGRFPEGEAAIAKNADYAYWYAHDIIEGRFPEGEAAIAKDETTDELYREHLGDSDFKELQAYLNKFHKKGGMQKKVKELTEDGETGFLSRMRSGIKGLVPGQIGKVGQAAFNTKLAAKKIFDQIMATGVGAGYGTAPMTLDQISSMPLFPDDKSKKILQKAWTDLGFPPGGRINKKQVEALSLTWTQIFQQNTPDAPEAPVPTPPPTTDIPNIAGSNGKNYAFKGGKWYLKQGRTPTSWIEIPPTDKRFELLNKKASEESI